ncbi:hypothetical protein M9H77_07709 [Catharanthus roseus]|uniref:Uncharacterized protein n=1 Tax=Catharanthus roseus TaxID=4058 RepID=A0ACC0BVN9_CATRO|nr:hypothetical protein M9H77_07709 [Catharanthus roseus]
MLREFTGSKTDDELAWGFIFLFLGGHLLPDMSGSLIHPPSYACPTCRDQLDFMLSNQMVPGYHTSLYRQSSTHDTQTYGYQPAGVNRRMMQTFAVQPSCRLPQEPVLERGSRGLKRGRRGGGSSKWERANPRSYVPYDPFDSPGGDAPTFTLVLRPDALSRPSGASTSYVPHDPFDSPIPSLSVPHVPISRLSSSDLEEHGDKPVDDVTPTQRLRFGPRVRSKTTRFTPSDYC